MAKKEKYLPPIHPGEILQTEFLEPLGLSQNRLAREIGVPPRRINEIVHGKRAITADTALRLRVPHILPTLASALVHSMPASVWT